MKPFGILELLRLRGLAADARVKFVRHIDKNYDVRKLIRDGHFEYYQKTQSNPIFDNLDYIISFLGSHGKTAVLYGVYKVGDRVEAKPDLFPENFPYDWANPDHVSYTLERDHRFDPLKHRIVIDWGASPISWHQHGRKDKAVVEIRPEGASFEVFDDYLDFTLTYGELSYIVNHSDANRDWRSRLAAVSGIYLILDSETGQQYIGSAYGTQGIWGRWKEYAETGDGGNKKQKEFLQSNTEKKYRFRYSILQILPKTWSKDKVIELESRYKTKLGTKATGLNCN